MDSERNSSLPTSDESEEEEGVSDGSASPHINVTDNEEDMEAAKQGKTSKASSATISLDLLSSIDTLSDPTSAPLDLGDLKQLERDKKAVYSHPLFPLLALLFEKCEMATRSINSFDSDPSLSAFNNEIEDFIEHQQRMDKPFFTDNPEVDSLMIRSIQVFRIHLLELEKVSELCKDFCHRYISCLRSKMRSDVLLRGNADNSSDQNRNKAYSEPLSHSEESNAPLFGLSNAFLSTSMSSMSSASPSTSSLSCSSPGSVNCSPPSSPSLSASSMRSSRHTSNHPPELPNQSLAKSPSPSSFTGLNFEQVMNPYLRLSNSKFDLFNGTLVESDSNLSQHIDEENMVAHDLSVKKESVSKIVNPDDIPSGKSNQDVSENVHKTTFKSKRQNSDKPGGGHSKRGVLPKQATSIMRSWLFQHIVHPYPTEDEKRAIASQTNLTLLQVNNWFINARRRILQPMLDSANTIHHELVAGNVQELDLSSKGKHTLGSKRLKTNSQPLNRFWPQSLANLIQTTDLNSKS